jgi:hypothetical protein
MNRVIVVIPVNEREHDENFERVVQRTPTDRLCGLDGYIERLET